MQRLVPKNVIKIHGSSFSLKKHENTLYQGFTGPNWITQMSSSQELKRDWIMKKSRLESTLEKFFNASLNSKEKKRFALELRCHLLTICFPTLNLSIGAIRQLNHDALPSFAEKLSVDEKSLLTTIIKFANPCNNDKTIPSTLERIIAKEIKKQVAMEVFTINLCRIIVGENSPKGKILLHEENGKTTLSVLSQKMPGKDLFYALDECLTHLINRHYQLDSFYSRKANPNGTLFEYFCTQIKKKSQCHSGLFRSLIIRLILGDQRCDLRFENMIIHNGEVVNVDTGNFLTYFYDLTHPLELENLIQYLCGGKLNPSLDENVKSTFKNGQESFAFYFSKHSAAEREIRETLERLHEVLSSDLRFLYDKFRTLPDNSELLSENDIAEIALFLSEALEQVKRLLPNRALENVELPSPRK